MDKLAELRRKLGALTDELNSDAIISDAALFDAKEAEIRATTEAIARLETAQQRAAALAKPAIGVHGAPASGAEAAADAGARTMSAMANELAALPRRSGQKPDFSDAISVARRGLNFGLDTSRHFRSFGEQLQAIANYYTSRGSNTDGRLVRAPTGAGEVDPTGGGFLVQVDFAAAVFMIAHNMGEILSRVNKIPISANANGLKIPGVDETSRATGSRWGGVQSNWAAEGIAGTESRPKFRLIEFDLKKLISKMTMTDELLQDSTALTAIASQAFSEEIMFMTEDAIFEGTGAGQPLGIINSGALVTVAKQTSQTAATIVKENIDAMWSRMAPRSRKNAIWLINQDIEPQLNQMNQAVGTGGQLVYLPPGGIANAPNATLYGRELVATEYNSALGALGDIALVDLSQYTIVDKGGVQMATSMHVAFDTDEMRFRITYRVDGKPMWAAPVTPFKGSLTKSPFVALAAR
jgi:HK97 family phage major capsid protein